MHVRSQVSVMKESHPYPQVRVGTLVAGDVVKIGDVVYYCLHINGNIMNAIAMYEDSTWEEVQISYGSMGYLVDLRLEYNIVVDDRSE